MSIEFNKILPESWTAISGETGLDPGSLQAGKGASDASILVSIGITGEYRGYLTMEGDQDRIFPLMELMMAHFGMNASPENRDENCVEAFKELANQVSGRLVMNLHELNIDCDITPPTIIRGSSVLLDLNGFPNFEQLLFSRSEGEIHINLGVKKT